MQRLNYLLFHLRLLVEIVVIFKELHQQGQAHFVRLRKHVLLQPVGDPVPVVHVAVIDQHNATVVIFVSDYPTYSLVHSSESLLLIPLTA